MPYCKRCNSRCEVLNIQATPSPYIQQGNCVRCNSLVYFFTNLPSETSSITPRNASRQHKKPAPRQQTAQRYEKEPFSFSFPRIKLNRRILSYSLLLLGMIALVFIGIQAFSLWKNRLPILVVDQSTLLRINNLSDIDWKQMSLVLNDKYSFETPNKSKTIAIPSHSSYYCAYRFFTTSDGKAFDPHAEIPTKLFIEANTGTEHPIKSEIRITKE